MKTASIPTKPEGTRSGQSAALRPKRAAPPPPPAAVTKDPNAPKPDSTEAMRSRIAVMTVAELNAFRSNAARIAAEDGNRKQEQAAELLPEIDAELDMRKATRLVVEADKRKESLAKRAATRATRKRLADAEEAATARLNDSEDHIEQSAADDDIVEELDGLLTPGRH